MGTKKEGALKVTDQLLNLLFPNTCGVCGKIAKDYLCPRCRGKLQEIQTIKKQIKIRQEEDYVLLSVFSYQDRIRELLLNFKFHDEAYLAKMFAKILTENEKICRFLKSYDIIIPVPVYFTKKWKRGYNQTEQIAKEMQKQIRELSLEIREFNQNEKYEKTKFTHKSRTKIEFAKRI